MSLYLLVSEPKSNELSLFGIIDELKSAFTTKLSVGLSPIVIVPPNTKLPSIFAFPVIFRVEPEITPKLTFWSLKKYYNS